jgi:hypothetical protein
MAEPHDASTKHLLDVYLADWLALSSRRGTGRVEVIDADLSTVTAAADKVLRIDGPPPWLLHVELQAHRDATLPSRLHLYNTLLGYRHSRLAWTLVVLLRRAAADPGLTGTFERRFPTGSPVVVFRYQLVRVWELPAETFLTGGLGILPLAPLSSVGTEELPQVIQRMD